MSKFNAGQIIVAPADHFDSYGKPEVVKGNLYVAEHGSGEGGCSKLWIANETGVATVYPEADFERANIRHLFANIAPDSVADTAAATVFNIAEDARIEKLLAETKEITKNA